jgi:hypothetical protein
MPDLELQVVVNEDLPYELESGVAFGDFQVREGLVYDGGPESLLQFYRNLLVGRPHALTFYTRKIPWVSNLVAIALFLRRDLAVHPKMAQFVMSADLASNYGAAGLAHVEPDVGSFLRFLRDYVVAQELGRPELGRRLHQAVEWIGEYILEDRLPNLRPEPSLPRILDVGTDGFVTAQSSGSEITQDDWIPLYRQGFLRGVLFTPPENDFRGYLASRKSSWLDFDLSKAAAWLNEAEKALRGPDGPRWEADGNWLWGPEPGTLLPPSSVLDVLTRV